MADVDADEVRRIAALARLHVSEADAKGLAEDLTRILDYVQTLQDVPVEALPEPPAMVTLRDDVVRPSLSRDVLLSSAPKQDGEGYVVPRVVG